MVRTKAKHAVVRSVAIFGAVCLTPFLMQAPAYAGGGVTNFKVKNCASQRIFVCSFDKTDTSMKIPYDAKGIQPGAKKQFGCASLGRCKVIIGVSKRKSKSTLSEGMKAAMSTASGGAAVIAVGSGGLWVAAGMMAADSVAVPITILGAGAASSFVALGAGGAVAGLEIADGLSDGQVCNQVRRAAKKAGLEPKDFMQNGKTYTVDAQYAVDKKGRVYLNADGTAVFGYKAKKGDSCSAPLKAQLIQ